MRRSEFIQKFIQEAQLGFGAFLPDYEVRGAAEEAAARREAAGIPFDPETEEK